MPVLTRVEPQKPNLSATLVERLARREKERSEGRSSLKARLRRWVGTGSMRQEVDNDRKVGMEARRMEPRVVEAQELECSIDSGIGLDSSSSSLPVKEEGEEQNWPPVQPTPILRSSRETSFNSPKAGGAVKKSISFSDGHSKSTRRRLRSEQRVSSAPRIVVSTWDSLGGRKQKAHYSATRASEMKLWSIDHTSSWPRVRPPPEKVKVAGWWWGPPSDSVSPQLGSIYNIIFAQVKEAAPGVSSLTMDLLFKPAADSLHTRIEVLSSSDIAQGVFK